MGAEQITRTAQQISMRGRRLYAIEDLEEMGGDAPYELIHGAFRFVQPVPLKTSVISARLAGHIGIFAMDHDLGYMTSAKGGYILTRDPDTVVAPDVGFIQADRLPIGVDIPGFCPFPPDFAAEVMSPWDAAWHVKEKIDLYLAAGVPLVWWVKPAERTVTVYRDRQLDAVYDDGDELDGDPVLPGFRLAVSEIFDLM